MCLLHLQDWMCIIHSPKDPWFQGVFALLYYRYNTKISTLIFLFSPKIQEIHQYGLNIKYLIIFRYKSAFMSNHMGWSDIVLPLSFSYEKRNFFMYVPSKHEKIRKPKLKISRNFLVKRRKFLQIKENIFQWQRYSSNLLSVRLYNLLSFYVSWGKNFESVGDKIFLNSLL